MDIDQLKQHLRNADMPVWADCVEKQVAQCLVDKPHGDLSRWRAVVEALPRLPYAERRIDQGLIQVGLDADITPEQRQHLTQLLQQLRPWRKGPYRLHGVMVDTEWRSDWKWERIAPHIDVLQGRTVLDVGCGNGYHCWRMAGAGAELVIGIDPMAFFYMQFQTVRHLLTAGDPTDLLAQKVWHLPIGVQDLPAGLRAFDTVFSMGVLYHRRSPLDHLMTLYHALKSGGQLVLETLVIEGDAQQTLMPQGRYAKMRNVWFIPSIQALENWLRRCGFVDVKTVDVNLTSTEEQRTTEWMPFESLADFLDPQHPNLTIEGYPAPRRAIVLARTR